MVPVVPAAVTAEEALVRGNCNLCHDVPQVAAPDRQESCQGCHVWIRQVAANPAAREKALTLFPGWERYERNVASYLEVPSLEAAMVRLEPSWVQAWLGNPHDLRPGLPETMPRLALDDPELAAIAAAFEASQVPVPSHPEPAMERVEAGRALFGERACGSCHAFGARWPDPGIAMAPDLAHARERMDPDRAVEWIRDPSGMSPAATMPTLGLSESEALALRDYLWLAEPGWVEAPARTEVLPVHGSPVTWAQVEERVFGKICAHCHMNPERNEGRRGPGNGGGFGYPPTGVELQTLEGVQAVESQVLRRVLLDRREENHRDTVDYGERPAEIARPEQPGMPLGLPALSDEDLALVLAWIDQGRPE